MIRLSIYSFKKSFIVWLLENSLYKTWSMVNGAVSIDEMAVVSASMLFNGHKKSNNFPVRISAGPDGQSTLITGVWQMSASMSTVGSPSASDVRISAWAALI
jgi:hypothetical protein